MNYFLTGASGYIGGVIAEKLQEAGHRIQSLARSDASAAKLLDQNITPVRGDLTAPEAWAKIAAETDGVIHTAFIHDFGKYDEAVASDRRVIAVLSREMAGTNKPLIVSNGSAFLGDTGKMPADETRPVENGSFFAARVLPESDALNAANQNVRSVVVRLPLFVYGRGGSVFVPLLLDFARKAGAAHYAGAGDNRTSALHVDDAAAFYLAALERAPAGSLYHAADESAFSARQIAEAVAQNIGVAAASITQARAEQEWGPGLTQFFMMNNRLNGAKARRDLGWFPQAQNHLIDDIVRGSYKRLS